jgi:hypothetical protein
MSACLGLSAFASQEACAYESWSNHFQCDEAFEGPSASLQVRYRLDPKNVVRLTGYAFYTYESNSRVKLVKLQLTNSNEKRFTYGGTNRAVNTNVSGISTAARPVPKGSPVNAYMSLLVTHLRPDGQKDTRECVGVMRVR